MHINVWFHISFLSITPNKQYKYKTIKTLGLMKHSSSNSLTSFWDGMLFTQESRPRFQIICQRKHERLVYQDILDLSSVTGHCDNFSDEVFTWTLTFLKLRKLTKSTIALWNSTKPREQWFRYHEQRGSLNIFRCFVHNLMKSTPHNRWSNSNFCAHFVISLQLLLRICWAIFHACSEPR